MRDSVRFWPRIAALLLAALGAAPARAENIRVGMVQSLASGPVYVAVDRGYFSAEGLNAKIVSFDNGQPVALAAAAGDIDFGTGAPSAVFYGLAGQGSLRIIAAGSREMPGFKNVAYLASGRAYEDGLTQLKLLPGHSVAITQLGSLSHYDLGLAAEKYKFDLGAMRLLALETNTELAAALTAGNTDAGVLTVGPAMQLLTGGQAKLLGWLGDEVPYTQSNTVFTSTKNANERPAVVERFLRALRKAARDYHEAFADESERRRDGPGVSQMLALLARSTHGRIEDIRLGVPWVDPELRLDVKDLRRQIAWFRAQGQLKSDVKAADIIDKRYVTVLPGRE